MSMQGITTTGWTRVLLLALLATAPAAPGHAQSAAPTPGAVSPPSAQSTGQSTAPSPPPSPGAVPKGALARPGFDPALLAPVEGINFQTYGHVSYALFRNPDGDHAAIFARFGLTKSAFDAAQAAYGERMKQDSSFAMVTLFGAYFAEMADGPYAALGRDVAQSVLNEAPLREAEPMPEEKFREIQTFYARKAATTGTDLALQDEVLKPYHLTFNDFNLLGAWFSRRLALDAQPVERVDPPPTDNGANDPVQHPEWGGLWRFTWTTLRRGETAMSFATTSRDICISQDMTAETLPLMPKPSGVKCVLTNNAFYATGIQIAARCDLGGIGTQWSLFLNPGPTADGGLAKGIKGQISYNEIYEGDDDRPQPQTDITVTRIGDCR